MTDRFIAQLHPIDLIMVEDSVVDAELIADSLREAGLTLAVRLVEDESAFIKALDERLPDAILSDWTLPDFSGRRAFAIARERCPDIPFIFVSGTISESTAFEALRAGASDYVFKHQLQHLFPALTRAVNEAEALCALQESENFLRTVLQTIPDLIWLKDSDGVYLTCNRMFERFFGAREADIVGKTDYDFVDREMADSFRDNDCQAMAAGKPRSNSEWITFADDGSRALFDTIKTPMFDAAGKLIGVLGVARDVTERQYKEDELRTAYHQLQEAQLQAIRQEKLATIGQLAAGVAHEINTPVGFIRSNLGSLLNYVGKLLSYLQIEQDLAVTHLSEEQRSYLSTLWRDEKLDFVVEDINDLIKESLEGTDRVKKTVQDLVGFARKGPEEMTPLNLNDCLERAISIAWHEIKLVGELKRSLGDLPAVLGDTQTLAQVFLNLLMNASHALEHNGTISICSWAEGEMVYASISDTGKGIHPDVLPNIFEPFFTTKDPGKGTGLGLSISADIIQKHGGMLTVESELGAGTTFTVRIPAACSGTSK